MATNSGNKDVKKLMGSVNYFKGSGLSFCIGDAIKPSYQDVTSVLRFLWAGGFTARYKLVQSTIPGDLLFTSGSKEQYHVLIPQIVRNAEWLVQTNQLDVFDPDNYRLVVGVYVLSWYWFHTLGGPKPSVKGLKEIEVRKIVQNEPLCCPICYKKYVPDISHKTQESKMWAYVEWLPTHCVEYHFYTPPKRLIAWVKKSALNALARHKRSVSKKGGRNG